MSFSLYNRTRLRVTHSTCVWIYELTHHPKLRYTPHSDNTTLLVLPSRDRGLGRTDFTLQSFGPTRTSLTLERIRGTLPFAQTVRGSISGKSAGGHSGHPDYGRNPQFRVVLGDGHDGRSGATNGNGNGHGYGYVHGKKVGAEVRVGLVGDKSVPWNIKLLWSSGGVVHE